MSALAVAATTAERSWNSMNLFGMLSEPNIDHTTFSHHHTTREEFSSSEK
jgi:hypothetical protein